ncbi:MAG: septum formation initiator family protein [SAR324 cluster bacterium]|nr:septum formation initiator family protein [SAR324 cluster bacterium]
MRDLKSGKFLEKQQKPAHYRKSPGTRDRVIFSKQFFPGEHIPSNLSILKEEAEWRTWFVVSILVLFGMTMIGISVVGDYGLLATTGIKNRTVELENEILRLQERENSLVKEVESLHSNVNYLEKLAKEELGLLRKNEHVYYLSSSDSFHLPTEKP